MRIQNCRVFCRAHFTVSKKATAIAFPFRELSELGWNHDLQDLSLYEKKRYVFQCLASQPRHCDNPVPLLLCQVLSSGESVASSWHCVTVNFLTPSTSRHGTVSVCVWTWRIFIFFSLFLLYCFFFFFWCAGSSSLYGTWNVKAMLYICFYDTNNSLV